MNTLYYGDNLEILRRYVADESVDLIYLDPPFNSKATYNMLFEEHDGSKAAAQFQAFEDTWHWDQVASAAYQAVAAHGGKVSQAITAMRQMLGDTDMLAYLSMMAIRLIELHRVLKPTGSIYLHCDPTASHYLKIIMDSIFGKQNFLNEIIWHYYNKFQRGDISMFARDHDVILFYSKESNRSHHFKSIYEKREKPTKQLKRKWDPTTGRIVNLKDENGHVVYDEKTERKIDDVWRLPYIVPASTEGLGYPTQKPISLLERIIQASSNPGDVVLDPFCGCGTAVVAAQKLGRQWIGIDITHVAITVMKRRLIETFEPDPNFNVIGEPTTVEDAAELAQSDPYQFQWWALGLVGARPIEEKKGADKGIDGRLYFHEKDGGETKQVIFSVKAGNITARHVMELHGVIDRENAALGVLITMEEPTKPMRAEAASGGTYTSPWGVHPKLQILTVGELLDGKKIDMPPVHQVNLTFKRAAKQKKKGNQPTLV